MDRKSSSYWVCRKRATELLLRQTNLETDFNILFMDHGDRTIIIDSIQNYCRLLHINRGRMRVNGKMVSGFQIYDKQNDIYSIFYNSSGYNLGHLRWIIAHEMGHIYMGHGDVYSDSDEIEANAFARSLLMPEYSVRRIIRDYGIKSAEDIARIFNVSETAARYRLNNLGQVFSVSEADQAIWYMQSMTIKDKIDRLSRKII